MLDDLKFKGIHVLDLTESNPTQCGFKYPAHIIDDLSNLDNLKYVPDSRGMQKARVAVGKFCDFDPARILLTASTSESYGFLMRLLLNPGDKVLIPKPSYPLFQFLLELNDAAFDYYPYVYDGQWRIDFDALEGLIDDATKAIILVNPNNPTGSYLKKNELARLNALCKKHALSIISDEVFFDYPLLKGDFVSLRDNAEVLTFVLGGLSKSLCLPQMKLGWLLASGSSNLVTQAFERLEIIADTYLSVNTPVQNALSHWLSSAASIQVQILERVRTNLAYLKNIGLNVLTVEGGWYAIVHIPGIDEEEFVLNALKEHHILIHPGFFFDVETPGHLVVSLLPQTEDFVRIKEIF